MTNRLDKIFQNLKAKNEKALITFSVSGYPDEETSLKICKAISDSGAHIHEINVPAEEAQADGPIIQLANIESIKNGITLEKTINIASELRAYNPELGICLMGYLNNIFIWTLIFISLALALLGFIDDYLKIKKKNSQGLNSKFKFLGQLLVGVLTILILINFQME